MKLFNRRVQKQIRQKLRSDLSFFEQRIWRYLRSRQILGLKFRRQHGIGFYVVDFYCPEIKLVIEIDGDSHYEVDAMQYDKKRDAFMRLHGILVLRFTNVQIKENIEWVIEQIEMNAKRLLERQPLYISPWEGENSF